MTNFQKDFLTMIYAVMAVCSKFITAWKTNIVFSASNTILNEKVPLIELNREAQKTTSKGITSEKKAKRNALVDKILYIGSRILSFASVTHNFDLTETIHLNLKKIKKCRDTDFISYCNNIANIAEKIITDLTPYDVSATLLTEVKTAIKAYAEYTSKPRSVKSITKTATQNLVVLFAETNEILSDRMDLDIEVFKTSHPDFYSEFKSARNVIITSGSVSSVLGVVTLKNSGEFVKNVTLTISPAVNGMAKTSEAVNGIEIIKKTSNKGKFRIASLPEGAYSIKIHKIGFQDQVIFMNIVNGETTNLAIVLEKE